MRKIISLITAAALVASISACDPATSLAVGTASSVGVAFAQEGGIKTASKDVAIKLQIEDKWFKSNFDMFRKLNLTVKEGRVLITGSVPSPEMRVDAVRLAWKVDGVKQVLNEIAVDDGGGVTGFVKDSVITGSLKTKLTFDKHIQSINYTIDTVKGNVYIMGIAQNQEELERVIEHARNTTLVSNVINYARLRQQSITDIK